MRFFFSGAVAKEAAENYGPFITELQNMVNISIQGKDYGSALDEIGIIPNILDLETWAGMVYKDRKLFQKKKKEADYRLMIDYNSFVKADKKGKQKLFIENMIKVVRDLGRKIKSKEEFDAEKLEKDILELFNLKVQDLNLNEI